MNIRVPDYPWRNGESIRLVFDRNMHLSFDTDEPDDKVQTFGE
jgi:hypothetical protein